jgi:hypothetical protein
VGGRVGAALTGSHLTQVEQRSFRLTIEHVTRRLARVAGDCPSVNVTV